VASIRGALSRLATLGQRNHPTEHLKFGHLNELYLRIEKAGLFDPDVYLSQQDDVRNAQEDPWWHFLRHGLGEGRHFTSPESAARCLAQVQSEFAAAREEFTKLSDNTEDKAVRLGSRLQDENIKIGIYCSKVGNFYMQEIADLLYLGLTQFGVNVFSRNEESDKGENFDIRVFIAPHEFFYLAGGPSWQQFISHPNTVLYNVEQIQTSWFSRAFPFLLQARLVLDINLQTAQILRRAGCNAIFFMPGYLDETPYTIPQLDISHIGLVRGYKFSKDAYDWQKRDAQSDRPIDVLFVGARTPYRDKSLIRLEGISEVCRFVCAYREATKPFTLVDGNVPAAEANWALSQRAKIVLNLHRDWIGYFEWSRMTLRGFWQGACVVTDPGLPNPVFEAGVHYLEESSRHLSELIRWLLQTEDGRRRLDSTRHAGYQRAKTLGSMRVALVPVLEGFGRLLGL
jgi:hypothetical protein